jgi:hypothetical protein
MSNGAPTLTKLLFVAFGGLIPGAFFGFQYQYGVRVEEKVGTSAASLVGGVVCG